MTNDEVLAQAKVKWGPHGIAWRDIRTDRCYVGWLSGGPRIRVVEGEGESWEEAFMDAASVKEKR